MPPLTLNHALSQSRSLCIDDLLNQPNVVWHRDRILSKALLARKDELDQLAKEGKIQLTGVWKRIYERNPEARRSRSIDATFTDVVKNPDFLWDYRILSTRKDLTLKIIDQIGTNRPWHWTSIAQHMLPSEICKDFYGTPTKPWCKLGLSKNRLMTPHQLNRIYDALHESYVWVGDWNLAEISTGINLGDGIIALKMGPWDLDDLSRHRQISTKIMATIQDRQIPTESNWNYRRLSRRLPIEEILADVDNPNWVIEAIALRPANEVNAWFRIWWPLQGSGSKLTASLVKRLGNRLNLATVLRYHDQISWCPISIAALNPGFRPSDLAYLRPRPKPSGLTKSHRWSDVTIV